jgi:hypothetical protein
LKPLLESVAPGILHIQILDFDQEGSTEYQISNQEEFDQLRPQLHANWIVKVNGIIMQPHLVFQPPAKVETATNTNQALIDPNEPF